MDFVEHCLISKQLWIWAAVPSFSTTWLPPQVTATCRWGDLDPDQAAVTDRICMQKCALDNLPRKFKHWINKFVENDMLITCSRLSYFAMKKKIQSFGFTYVLALFSIRNNLARWIRLWKLYPKCLYERLGRVHVWFLKCASFVAIVHC